MFTSASCLESELLLVAECKQKTRKDGIEQLKLYLDMSQLTTVGVWFNGDKHEYLRKVYHKGGRRVYETLPNVPRFGQRVEDSASTSGRTLASHRTSRLCSGTSGTF